MVATFSLYQSLLGESWARLDERVRAMHAPGGVTATGRFTITHGARPLARVLAWAARLPPAGENIPVTLRVEAKGTDGEVWRRKFGATRLVTWQKAVDGNLAESFGLVIMGFQLTVEEGALVYRQVKAWLQLGPVRVALPGWLAPCVRAREWAHEREIQVLVEVSLPVAGPLITYRGEIMDKGKSNE